MGSVAELAKEVSGVAMVRNSTCRKSTAAAIHDVHATCKGRLMGREMSCRVEDIESWLRSGEDSGWEFKQVGFSDGRPTRPTRDDWADEIAAFANAAGGVVLAGVADDGTVIGMSRGQIANLDSLLVEVSTDTIKPPVRIRTYHRELSDGKLVLLAEVPRSDFAHESPGGNYIRVAGSRRLLGSDEG